MKNIRHTKKQEMMTHNWRSLINRNIPRNGRDDRISRQGFQAAIINKIYYVQEGRGQDDIKKTQISG